MNCSSRSLILILTLFVAVPVSYGQETAEWFYNQSLEVNKTGNYEEAIRLLDQAIRLNSNYVEALLERSRAKQQNPRDLDGAMADIQTVLQLDPSNGQAYFERARLRNSLIGQMLEKTGGMLCTDLLPYHKEILDDVNTAITNSYRNKITLEYRANLLSRWFGKYPEAIADYTEALSFDPKDIGLYFNRSAAKRRMDDQEGAADDLRLIIGFYDEAKAVQENPEDMKLAQLKMNAVTALIGLSSIYALVERHDLQLWAIEKSIELKPNAMAYESRGRHHMIFGELSNAIADYTTAIEMNKGNSSVGRTVMSRGIVYWLNGEPEKAEADFAEGMKYPQLKRYNLKYWKELARRQREQRMIRVKLPGS